MILKMEIILDIHKQKKIFPSLQSFYTVRKKWSQNDFHCNNQRRGGNATKKNDRHALFFYFLHGLNHVLENIPPPSKVAPFPNTFSSFLHVN